jgi:hypothetical protein
LPFDLDPNRCVRGGADGSRREVRSIGQEIGVRARQAPFHHDYDIVCVVPIQADQGGQHLVLIGAVSMTQARIPRLMISPLQKSPSQRGLYSCTAGLVEHGKLLCAMSGEYDFSDSPESSNVIRSSYGVVISAGSSPSNNLTLL